MKLKDVVTRCITDDSLPWLPLTPHADLVSMKLLSADPVRGEVILVLRAPPGIELPRHRTSGATTIYTLQGRWKYREHDWVAGPGSLVIEPASSCHTPQILGDGTDDAVMLILLGAELQLLDAEDRIIGTEDWRSAVERYLEYCRENEIEPRDVTGHAGCAPQDMDVAEVHDATAMGEIMQVEDLGFVAPGEGGPVNPSGGLESRGHPLGATGLAQVYEPTTQLRGEAGARHAIRENDGGFQGVEEAAVAIHILSR